MNPGRDRKICTQCGCEFFRPYRVSFAQFERRRTCSRKCASLFRTSGDAERLLSMVEKTSGCWLFQGTSLRGYGQFRYMGKTQLAHRASYMLFVGPIEPGLYVCHKCDVRSCINPDHLFLGTQSDNMKDCVSKGRNFVPKHNLLKLFCPKGHSYSGDNLILNGTWRRCKTCTLDKQNDRRRRAKAG